MTSLALRRTVGLGLAAALALAAAPAASGAALTSSTPASSVAAGQDVALATASSAAPRPIPTGNVRYRADIDGDGRADTVTFRKVTTKRGQDYFRLAVTTARGKSASTTVSTDGFDKPASDYWVGVTGIDGIRGNEVVLDLVGGVGDATAILSYAWRNGRIVLVPAAGSPARWPDWDLMWVDFGQARGWTFSQQRSVRYVVRHDLKVSSSGRFFGTNTRYRWAGNGWQKVSSQKVSGLRRGEAAKLTDLNGLIWR